MKLSDLTVMLRDCVASAHAREPVNSDYRARCFIAQLAGSIETHDAELAAAVFSILTNSANPPAARPTTTARKT